MTEERKGGSGKVLLKIQDLVAEGGFRDRSLQESSVTGMVSRSEESGMILAQENSIALDPARQNRDPAFQGLKQGQWLSLPM